MLMLLSQVALKKQTAKWQFAFFACYFK